MKLLFLSVLFFLPFLFLNGQEPENRIQVKGYAAISEKGEFSPYTFTIRPPGKDEVLIEILYSGICHSDLHHVHADWRKESYPMVPGHEIAGRIVRTGSAVTKFKNGDYAGVGCLTGSCLTCESCISGREQDCSKRVLTYASPDARENGALSCGGYSQYIVVPEHFALKIPDTVPLEQVAPLLCAGITTYSPLRYSLVGKDSMIGVAGFGGLGHMAVKYAKSFGAKVTVFDIDESKCENAFKMGAERFVNVNTPDSFRNLENHFDMILSTIPAKYDPVSYVKLLKFGGELAIVGLPANRDVPSVPISGLIFLPNRKIYGSQIGGIHQTQEMLDYSFKHGIYPDIELIAPEKIAEAYRNVLRGNVKFRYVIDMKKLK